jgi:hypothetical protein
MRKVVSGLCTVSLSLFITGEHKLLVENYYNFLFEQELALSHR